MDHLRAVAVLVVQALLVLLGTPGLDYIGRQAYSTPKERAALEERSGALVAAVAIGAAEFNRAVRLPLTDIFDPLQRPFRVSQLWSLYRDGPGRLRRLEVHVDDRLVYRSVDAEHDWLAPQLRNRRVRPVVESTCTDEGAPNWRGLSRFVAMRAREAFPGVREVRLDCTAGKFPGHDATYHHGYVVAAPDWEPKAR